MRSAITSSISDGRQTFGDDPLFTDITPDDLHRFLNYLQDDFCPDSKNPGRHLSAKTARNAYVTLSFLWT